MSSQSQNDGSRGLQEPPVSEWNTLLSRIVNRDTEGVRQWCETWGNIPLATQTNLLWDRTSPMCEAACVGSGEIIDILVHYGFHPNLDGKLGNQISKVMPIHQATINGHVDVVKKLVEDCNVPVDTINSFGWTSLMWAVNYGHAYIVWYLLTQGADANYNHVTPRGRYISPLDLAVLHCSTDIVVILVEFGADVNIRISGFGTAVNKAVALGLVDMVKLLHARGANLDALSDEGTGIMHLALGPRPNIVVIRHLIALNVCLDVVSTDGVGPLCYGLLSAAEFEVTLQWVSLLLDAGHRLSREDYHRTRTLMTFTKDELEKLDNVMDKHFSEPRTLKQICCFRIRRILGVRLPSCIDQLFLPGVVKEFLCLKHLDL